MDLSSLSRWKITSSGGSHAAYSRAWELALLQNFHLLSPLKDDVNKMMKFNLARLLDEPAGSKMSFDIDEAQQRLAEDLRVDFVRGTVEFTRSNRGIFGKGQLHSQIQLECARCLETFSQPLDFHLEAQFGLPPIKPQEGTTFPIGVNGILDLTEALREQILLDLPMRPLCRPDCRGLCIECGKDLNEGFCDCVEETTDTRLAGLRELLRNGD
ncbi:MAG: hypothetical protein FJ014_19690 [Chloroflexi bacterium]|nr:hypothetical protein [Chloroflexota bacterium]